MMPCSLLALLTLRTSVAACPAPGSAASFLDAARRGELAFAEMDAVGLSEAREEALAVLPCLAEPITTELSAAFHRMMAMAAFAVGDEPAVLAEFHAARRLEPGYAIPEDVAPVGHPLVTLYEAAATADEGSLDPTLPPAGGHVTVDGVLGAPRPTGISTLIQSFGSDGALEQTLFLQAGEPTPAFGPIPLDTLRRARRRIVLFSSAGAALATGALLYGLAWREHTLFWDLDDPIPDDDLTASRARTNGLFLASAGAGTLGAGLGVTAVILW